ncbi:hypothetical protein MWN34_04405 [Ancylobacter sp. 6x-1]|uniref:Uncharacterized protein n=1 Tax=Ancylobacter crimeensis TaxID=2579147 RepID=A0ABT0D873_9HYPH|nr:hypothetical protein [Ancylobacter crimeensis]MCK0196148.1 hypothetical protein [Ancylobacter crimeensis]
MLNVSGRSSLFPRSEGEAVLTVAAKREVPNAVALGTASGTVFARMTQHLAQLGPRTDAEALRALRQAFPAVPLSDRVAVLAERNRQV